jgi:site-specific DNA-cytosine methylase
MNVLSLFDGISCARVSLDRADIPVKTYYACEIDKHAIKISETNYPDIVRLGDVRTLHTLDEPIDLLIGGSPCTDLSIAKKDRKGLEGNQSSLFYEYVRIWKLVKPRWFVLENVASMPKKDKDIITEILGVEPIMINAALVSAQSRKRLFWTNIPDVSLPADRGILLKDILQPDAEVDESMVVDGKSFCLTSSYHKVGTGEKETEHNKARKQRTMVKVQGISNPRKLTPIECERLQGLPDDYTSSVAKTHRYKCIGNAFNVDVVAHILKSSQKNNEPAD